MRDVGSRWAGALLAVLALFTSMLVSAGPVQAAAPLPGGKANWVVSVGHMDLASKDNYRNWVRLGYYVFNTNGTVTTSYWNWNQRDQPRRVDAMTADCGGAVPTCTVRTVDGFADDPTGVSRAPSATRPTDGSP